jgi:serine/threonine-protein kinase
MPTAPTTSAELIELLRKSGVVSPPKLAQAANMVLPAEPQKAAAALVTSGIITRFQAQQLLAGRHKGFRLGSYAILDLLGRGGMGAVYLAEHLGLHRKVAIKVLITNKDDDQKLAIEAFQREARAVAALDHPNIVRIFDVSSHNDTPFLVMEYVEGDSLQQMIERDGSIPYPAATEYIGQVAAGLQHAHERGFVHRDIKPANLMRDRSGNVKILDMGLAQATSKENGSVRRESDEVAGTADFIAPEQGRRCSRSLSGSRRSTGTRRKSCFSTR